MGARSRRSVWRTPPPLLAGYTFPLRRYAAAALVKTLLRFGYGVRPNKHLIATTYAEFMAVAPKEQHLSPRPVYLFMAVRRAVRKTFGNGVESVRSHRASMVYVASCRVIGGGER